MKQSTMRVRRIQASTQRRPGQRVVPITAPLLVLVALSVATISARAAELSGVILPDTRGAAGVTLVLNGIGLRTYSIFRVPIYVAGLYLEQRSSNADAILRSQGVKLLELQFLHDVGAKDARQAWQEGFEMY